MTGRTHDLAGFTALNLVFVNYPLTQMSLATLVTALGANFIGSLAADLDHATSGLWQKFRGGSIIGRIIAPLLGSHRMISHSLLGVYLFGVLSKWFLESISNVLIVDMNIVWWSFMIGLVSHLLGDIITKDGVPLFFPIPWHIGLPPLRALRIKAGGLIEKSFIFPGLMLVNAWLVYTNYTKYLDFLRDYIK